MKAEVVTVGCSRCHRQWKVKVSACGEFVSLKSEEYCSVCGEHYDHVCLLTEQVDVHYDSGEGLHS